MVILVKELSEIVLIIGCNSDKAKDKIVRQGEKIKLQDVIEILQLEDSTRQTLTEMTSTTQKIHYASYEKKKGTGKKQKFQSNSNSSSSSSSGQETGFYRLPEALLPDAARITPRDMRRSAKH